MAESEDLDMDALGFSSSQSEYYEKLMKASDDQDNEIIRAMVEANELVDDVETIGNENLDERHKVKIDRKTSFEQQVSSLMKPQDSNEWKLKEPEEKAAYNRARDNFRDESFDVITLRIAFSSVDAKKHFLTRHGLPFKDTIHESELYASSTDSGSSPRNEPTRHKDDDAGSGEPVDNEWET
jgi:predicted DNA binding CopG/RHH family protein